MIDKDILHRDPPLPAIALAIAQLTSAQATRWFVVVSMVLIGGYMLISGTPIPDTLIGVFGLIIGSLFDTPNSLSSK